MAVVEGNTYTYSNLVIKKEPDGTFTFMTKSGHHLAGSMRPCYSGAELIEFLKSPYVKEDKEILVKQSEIDELKKRIAEIEGRGK